MQCYEVQYSAVQCSAVSQNTALRPAPVHWRPNINFLHSKAAGDGRWCDSTAHHTAHCSLHTKYCSLHSAYCTSHTSHYTLNISHWTLHTAHFSLYIAHCNLHPHTTYQTLDTLYPRGVNKCTSGHFIIKLGVFFTLMRSIMGKLLQISLCFSAWKMTSEYEFCCCFWQTQKWTNVCFAITMANRKFFLR